MVGAIRNYLPETWNRYFEPMAGGAALFFALRPPNAILADVNTELMNFYAILKSDPSALEKRLRRFCASREFYYALRGSRLRTPIRRAARFAYLNRLAWNGLYRVNRSGEFNVPIGDRLPATMWNFEELRAASAALVNATLLTGDFSHVLRYAREDDFVFLDPPYPRGAADSVGFNRYSTPSFNHEDHARLAKAIDRLTARGVRVLLTLADRGRLHAIYPSSMRRRIVRSKALIACNGHDRRNVAELILTNY